MILEKILNIKPSDLPVHPIHVVVVRIASDTPAITEHRIKVDCIITNYMSKDRPVEILMTIFHNPESYLKNQTTNI